MNLLSLSFFFFFLMLLAFYYLMPKRHRWIVLLAGSYLFYAAAGLRFVPLLLFTTVWTYLAARKLGVYNRVIREELKQIGDKSLRKEKKEAVIRKKKRIVALTLAVNVSVLFFFKTSYLWKEVPLLLPLGISFYTFQTIGYLIDVYRAQIEPEQNLLRYALFASYFPQIIQGPIHRYRQLGSQLFEEKKFSWREIKLGFWLFLWGMFKKIVISERAAVFVSHVLGSDLQETPGAMLLLGVFVFNLQLYTDFSGGIDMVSGISQMFGITLAENFRRPFFARTLGEYWHRWHITLGTWIKDYVFYPIAMSRTFGRLGKRAKDRFGNHIGRTLPAGITSVITFILIGLWHDVTGYYFLYGIWHGMLMALSNLCEPLFERFRTCFEVRTECLSYRWMQRLRTFMIVTVGEYFSLATGMAALGIMFRQTLLHFEYSSLFLGILNYGLDGKDWLVLAAGVLVLICVSMKQESGVRIREALERQNLYFQWLMVLGILLTTAVFGVYGPGYDASAFIYGGF